MTVHEARRLLSLAKWNALRHWRGQSVNRNAWARYWHSYRAYKQLAARADSAELSGLAGHLLPCPGEDTAQTYIEPIYFYQDCWAFEKIVQQRPAQHVDVGSHHKTIGLLSKVVPTVMVDIRPLAVPLESLTFQKGSILEMPFPDQSLLSVSSLCVVEHIGLGRYGDPLDIHGSTKALAELKRVVAPGGDLYLSVPLDDQNRTYFNAHRAFAEHDLLSLFAPFEVLEKRYIYGNQFQEQPGTGFGTGCYHLRRPL